MKFRGKDGRYYKNRPQAFMANIKTVFRRKFKKDEEYTDMEYEEFFDEDDFFNPPWDTEEEEYDDGTAGIKETMELYKENAQTQLQDTFNSEDIRQALDNGINQQLAVGYQTGVLQSPHDWPNKHATVANGTGLQLNSDNTDSINTSCDGVWADPNQDSNTDIQEKIMNSSFINMDSIHNTDSNAVADDILDQEIEDTADDSLANAVPKQAVELVQKILHMEDKDNE